MKIQNKKDKTLGGALALISVMLLGFSMPHAFANSDTAYSFSPNAENPSYSNSQCDGSSPACAYSPSTGEDQIIATSSSSTVESATAYNNEDSTSVGSSPSLQSSASTIDYNAYIEYNGVDTESSPGYASMVTEVDMYDQNGMFGYCDSSPIETNGDVSGSYYEDCSAVNSGTNTFYEGVFNNAQAQGGNNVDEADYWGGTNAGYVETYSMTICDDGTCYK